MRLGPRSVGKSVVVGVAIALIAAGCSAQESRSALGSDSEQVEASSLEAEPSTEPVEPALSPSPLASAGSQPGDAASAPGAGADTGSLSPSEDFASASPSDTLTGLDDAEVNSMDPGPQVGFIFDIIGLGFDLIGLAFDIADASSGQGQAQATDLTEVYQRLDRIESSLEQSRVDNQARFSELQNELNRQGMEASIRQFIDIENNGDEAMRAWLVIHQCRINRARSQPTCPDLGGVQRPVEDSILRARSTLIDVVDNRWSNLDIPTLAGSYNSRGAGRGLVEGAWNFLRTKQNNAAQVPASSPIRSGQKMPVITPELSSGMNAIIEYYAVLIARYAFLRQVAVLEKDPTQNGCQWYEHIAEFFKVNVCQRRLMEQIGQEANRWIDGTGSGSVLQAAATYKMPIVPQGAIAVAGIGESITVPTGITVNADNVRRILFADSSLRPPVPQTPYRVAIMEGSRLTIWTDGQNDFSNMLATLQKYSSPRDVIAAYPGSFAGFQGTINAKVRGWSNGRECAISVKFDSNRGDFSDGTCAIPDGSSWNFLTREVREPGTDYPMFGW